MKWLIAADLHGSALYTKKLLEAFEREGAGRLLLLGDLLYHGPRNDLPQGYAPKEVMALLNPLAAHIHCVRGNCEAEVDQMVLDFPVLSESCLLDAAGRLLYATPVSYTHLDVYKRQSLFRALLIFGILQGASNAGYWLLSITCLLYTSSPTRPPLKIASATGLKFNSSGRLSLLNQPV